LDTSLRSLTFTAGFKFLLLPITLFLGLALYQIDLPGLHYDEAFEVVPAAQLLDGQPVNAFRESALTLFGKKFPLMTQDYIGALNTYGSIPFLLIGGATVASLRSYAIVIGLLTLLLVYGFITDLSGRKVAGLATVALLAVNPSFVFWTRQGIFVTAIASAIGVAAAWSWLRWQRRRNYRYALLGAFLFGLGIYAKLLFVWLIAALFGAFVINEWANRRKTKDKIIGGRRPVPSENVGQVVTLRVPGRNTSALLSTGLANRATGEHVGQVANLPGRNLANRATGVWRYVKQGGGLLLAGALGCWPLIVYNLQTGGTFKSIGQNSATSYYGVDNFAVLSNLTTRSEQLVTLLNGGHFWYLGDLYVNPILPIVFGLAFIASLWLAMKHKKTTSLIPFVVIGLVVLQSIVTVSALWITHFALIMAWPAMALAVTGAELLDYFSRSRTAKIALTVIFTLLIAAEAHTTWRYHQALSLSGGLSDHSDAVYDMAAWLEQNTAGSTVAMDWGLSAPVTYLTAGRVTPIEVFGYDWGDTSRFEQILAPHLTPEESIFLWRSPDETIFHRSADFQALYNPLDLEEDILEAFYERSGRPIYGATQLVPVGAAKNKP